MKKGVKVWGLVVVLMVVASVFSGIVSAENISNNISFADQSLPLGPVSAASLTVPSFKQCDSRWGANQLGTCSDTICSAGCAVTSVAMILKYYGVPTDPGELNNYLRDNSGYASGCLIIWDKADDRSGGSVIYAGRYDSNIPNQVTWEIDHGYPCVGGLNGHFVVITGYSDSLYYINDPSSSSSTISKSSITKIHTYHGSGGDTTSYNPQAAVNYAETWCHVYNSNNPNICDPYKDYRDSGGDCANFVSQSLIAGGLDLSAGTVDSCGCIISCTMLNNYLVNSLKVQNETWSRSRVMGPEREPIWFVPGDPAIFGKNNDHPTTHAVIAVTGDAYNYATCNSHTPDVDHKSIRWFLDTYPDLDRVTFYHIPTSQSNYPIPTITASGNDAEIDVGETDWVKFTIRNDGTEYTESWGIQVRVGDGLELDQFPGYDWQAKICDDTAAEWYKTKRLDPGEEDIIWVGIRGKTLGSRVVNYTAWMHDQDSQPKQTQYSHPYSSPCIRDYASYGVVVIQPIQLPQVTTNAATGVEGVYATLNGVINSDGGEACQYRFEYDTNSGEPYAYNTGWTGSKTTGQSFSQALTSLNKGTKYYFRAQAKNSAGTASGSELTFLTKPDAPSSFSATTAGTTQIDLSWSKGAGAQKTKIQRKTGSWPADKDDGTQVYFDTGTSTPNTGLTPDTTYYYRAWSYVQGSEQWSSTSVLASATTLMAPVAPTVTTNAATLVEETTATLNGVISSDGGASIDERRFRWGTTSSCSDGWVTDNPSSDHYGSFDISGNSFSYRLTGLQPNTKYYFQAGAHNSAGWGWGTALSFTTSQNQAPTLSSGYVTPSSGDTSTTFYYYVTYTDADGDAPTTKYVYINGTEHTMTLTSGTYTSGAAFKYSTTLSSGSHNYYFYFDDGHAHTVRLPTSGTSPGPSVSTPGSYIDGLNVDGIVDTTKSYGGAASFFAFEYTPSISYNLKKVELIAGRGTGTVTIQLRPDDNGMPSNIVLRETSFTQIDTVSWQGSEFTTPYPLTAGETYWVVFTQIANSQMSVATSGDIITHGWTIAGFTYWWTYHSLPWMAKFYGEGKETTPPTWDTTVGIQSATDTGNGGEVTVTYGTATDADSPPVKYNVYFSTSSPATGGTKVSNVGSSPYTVTGLTNGQLYFFSVRAEDSATPENEDTNTVELTATPTAPGPTATNLGVYDATGDLGTYMLVPVNITNTANGPIMSIKLDVLYDEAVLELVSLKKGELTTTWGTFQLGSNKHSLTLATMDLAQAISNGSTGSVVLLNFSLIGACKTSPMDMSNIQLFDPDGNVGTAPPKNGTFTVTGGLGSISGKVTYTCNTTGIAGATVNLTQGGSVINSTVTDSNGEYSFTDVPFGNYEVKASKVNFWDNSTSVTVSGAMSNVDLALWPRVLAPAADNLGVEDALGNPNTYVDVPVNITNTTYAITGIQFNIVYDSTVINLTGIKYGDLTSTGWGKMLGGTAGANVIILDTDPGNAIGIGQSGSVVLLNFSVENVPGLSSPMNISDIKLADTSIPPQKGTAPPKNGTFTVVGGLGSISGKITYTCNTTGIAGATVNLTQGEIVIASTVTNSNGSYTFANVPLGAYSVNTSKVHFWDNATDVTVTAGAPSEADMMLWLKGDVYNDGVLDIYDIIMLRQAAAENIPWDYRYDLYADATVDIYDIIVLRQAVAGNIVLD